MYLGIDIGGTNLKVGIIDDRDNLIFKDSRKTNAKKGAISLIDDIIYLIKSIVDYRKDIISIGFGVPGIVNENGTVILAPNLTGWIDIPFKSIIKSKFDLPIAIDNDANVAAYAEHQAGAGKGQNSMFYLTLGTGVGGAIINNGEIYKGANGGAGEIGHTIINYKEEFGTGEANYRTGILEELAGKNQIIRLGKEKAKQYPNSLLNKYEKIDVRNISDAANENDLAALQCLEQVGEYLGIGLTSALNLLDIHFVVVGGGVSHSNRIMLDTALETIKLRALPIIANNIKIVNAKHRKDAGIIGAALLGKHFGK